MSQILIARVNTDPKANVLLEVISSGTASQLHSVEFQALINELDTTKQSRERSNAIGSPIYCTELQRNFNNSRLLNGLANRPEGFLSGR